MLFPKELLETTQRLESLDMSAVGAKYDYQDLVGKCGDLQRELRKKKTNGHVGDEFWSGTAERVLT